MDESLLDTDILNEILKQRNSLVVQHAAAYLAIHGRFTISAITRYELLRGLKEKDAKKQLDSFEVFCRNTTIEIPDLPVLDRASDLWALARRNGFPALDADLIIAATALQTGRVLVTGNTAHFSWIPGLQLANWRQAVS